MSDHGVRLMHYDPRWRQEFLQTRSSIFLCTEGDVTNVEHIGSTAISGLVARPTIDVVASVVDESATERAIDRIEGINFRAVATPLWADGSITLVKPRYHSAEDARITHRVFLVTDPSSTWSRTVAIRKYLENHPDLAIEFEEAKRSSWQQHEGQLDAYQADKAAFFNRIEDLISLA